MDLKKLRRESQAVYTNPCPLTGAHTPPIYQTSTFVFANAKQGAQRFAGEEGGYIYSRLGNPTVNEFERKMALLEEGEEAVAFGSGMASISASILAFAQQGDHIVAQNCLYGCTHSFLTHMVKGFGIDVTFVDASDSSNIERAMQSNTKIIFIESPANPIMALTDIAAAAKIAHSKGARLIADNTFMTPYYQNPLQLGADLVLHSATKYIGGHGDVVAGVAVGKHEDMHHIRMTTQKDIGGITSPFDAWLLLRGLKTLALRMQRHEENAHIVANYLQLHPKVDQVYYPGLTTHPQHQLAQQQARGFGAMIAFELRGGLEAGITMMDNIELIHLAVSLGAVDSLIQHPASMTHSPLSPEERLDAGITEGLVRLSVGVENAQDIVEYLDAALDRV